MRRSHRDDAVYQTLASAAVGELLGSLESLKEIRLFDRDGPLRGTSELKEGSRVPRALRSWLDGRQGAAALKAASIGGAVLVLTGRRSRARQVIGAALMYGSTSCAEWRSPYGRDGADQMAAVINGYRVLTAAVPDRIVSDDLFLHAVSLQTAISYFSSGAAKAISSSWLSGEALDGVLRTQMYGRSPVAQQLQKHPDVMKALTWSTVIWETCFPLVFLLPARHVRPALWSAKLFHAGVAVTMGLPRFFFGFHAAHHSVEYVLTSRRNGGTRGVRP